MAIKHIREYYNQICDQYHEMILDLHDFEKEAQTGLIEPERLDQIKESIQPLINNYQTLSYIMFLLNKPIRKQKHKAYEERNKEFLNKIEYKNTKQGKLIQNEEVLNKLESLIKK